MHGWTNYYMSAYCCHNVVLPKHKQWYIQMFDYQQIHWGSSVMPLVTQKLSFLGNNVRKTHPFT
jgi:hypothetical protein